MERSAIEAIQENAVAQALNARINEMTATPVAVIPENCKIVSLDSYNLTKTIFTGSFNTSLPEDFAAYIKARGNSEIFIGEGTATAFFDLGSTENPGHGNHKANLTLKKTAPYNAFLKVTETRLNQRALAEWLEDWGCFISATDADGTEIPLKQAIRAVRGITVERITQAGSKEGNFRAERTAMEKLEAKADEFEIPTFIIFKCTPFEGFAEANLTARLSIIAMEKEIALAIRWTTREQAEMAMEREFRSIIQSALNGHESQIYIGSFKI